MLETLPEREVGENDPARLDLVFILSSLDIEDIAYERPFGASNHLVLCFDYIVELQVERVAGIGWVNQTTKGRTTQA